MRFAMFYHSLLSDWNHGNAHFLRGVVSELQARGHEVRVFEPADAWSRKNLLEQQGPGPIARLRAVYPGLHSTSYAPGGPDLDRVLEGMDFVIVHEWTDPDLVRRLGQHRGRGGGYRLLFHDTHHRGVTEPGAIDAYQIARYDGVLAFGRVLADLYRERGWARRAWVWHEAADTRVFRPRPGSPPAGDLVWIGNWGDGERGAELREFLVEPVRALGLVARVHGVRYPEPVRQALAEARIQYSGWVANHDVPQVLAGFRFTVHVPRRPYVTALRGIPTIRVFEALACGIPLVCSPWHDTEGLFTAGQDYLQAANGDQMTRHLRDLREDPALASELAEHGLATILARHTCAHRVDELLAIADELGVEQGS